MSISITKKTVSKRIRITKNGKIIRRPMGIDHFRSRKSKRQIVQGRKGSSVHSTDSRSIMRELTRNPRF